MPTLQRFNGIRINMPFQLPCLIALRPDHTLQCLERRGFAVFGDPAQEDFNNPFNIGLRLVAVATHGVELFGDISTRSVLAHKFGQMFGGVGKQHVEDETHRAGGAFNVGEDGFDRHGFSPPDAGSDRRCLRR